MHIENGVRGKTLQNLELCLQLNYIIFLTTIDDLFNYFEHIFGNFHQKKYVIEKFQVLKIITSLFNNIYFELI